MYELIYIKSKRQMHKFEAFLEYQPTPAALGSAADCNHATSMDPLKKYFVDQVTEPIVIVDVSSAEVTQHARSQPSYKFTSLEKLSLHLHEAATDTRVCRLVLVFSPTCGPTLHDFTAPVSRLRFPVDFFITCNPGPSAKRIHGALCRPQNACST